MDFIVIRIRYLDLSAGLHAIARSAGGTTTIYLRPGLTPPQRQAALRRLRQESRVGCGPRLPAAWLALATMADRARMAARQVIAVVRLHPAAALAVPLAGATAGLLLVTTVPRGGLQHHQPTGLTPELVAQMLGRYHWEEPGWPPVRLTRR
ncbi:MAG TPA: hypothetical protein VMG38_00830 [Trebonia sp.]|nr:hypothetical protein [Trebonia sp.]